MSMTQMGGDEAAGAAGGVVPAELTAVPETGHRLLVSVWGMCSL